MTFCHHPENATPIAQRLVSEAYEATGEINAPLKRLVSGIGQYAIGPVSIGMLERMEAHLLEAARDARAILDAQREEQASEILDAAE